MSEDNTENLESLDKFLESNREEPEAGTMDESTTADFKESLLSGESSDKTVLVVDADRATGSEAEDAAKEDALGDGIPEQPAPIPLMKDPVLQIDPIRESLEEFSRRFQVPLEERIGVVEVTDREKEDFLRAVLNDDDVFFGVTLPGAGLSIKIRIPTSREIDAIRAATARLINDESVAFDNSLTAMQAMYAYVQIVSVGSNDEPFEYDHEKPRTHKELVRELADPELIDSIMTTNPARWWVYMDALRVAEAKSGVCQANLYSGDFFA